MAEFQNKIHNFHKKLSANLNIIRGLCFVGEDKKIS